MAALRSDDATVPRLHWTVIFVPPTFEWYDSRISGHVFKTMKLESRLRVPRTPTMISRHYVTSSMTDPDRRYRLTAGGLASLKDENLVAQHFTPHRYRDNLHVYNKWRIQYLSDWPRKSTANLGCNAARVTQYIRNSILLYK